MLKIDQNQPTKWGEFVRQKNPQKRVWSAIVPGYLVLFIFVCVSSEMGSDREIKPKWFQ